MIDVIVGGGYGDEGKGKIVNYMCHTRNYDYIFRVNASTNASHTVSIGGKTYVTKQLPSSFGCKSKLVVSPGAVLNLLEFKEELYGRPDIDDIRGNVMVAGNIPLILPGYISQEKSDERKNSIGTTNQGTGVAQVARVARHAVTLYDVKRAIRWGFMKLVEKIQSSYSAIGLEKTQSDCIYDASMLCDTYLNILGIIDSFCVDYTKMLSYFDSDTEILIEGCNGVMLDNVHGVWPYVTSCSTTVSSLLGYANLSPYDLRDTYVVMGIYSVCLNNRPFVTEILEEDVISKISAVTNEVDPAENMMRRLGWFDIPTARRALIGHRGAKLVLTKLDALAGDLIGRVCTHYVLDGREVHTLPDDTERIQHCVPSYVQFEMYDEMIKFIEEQLDVEVPFVSNGKDSSDIITGKW